MAYGGQAFRRRSGLLAALGLGLVLGLTACGSDNSGNDVDSAATATPQSPVENPEGEATGVGGTEDQSAALETTDVRIGPVSTSAAFITAFVADDQGFFEAEGLNAELVLFSGSPNGIQGLLAGEADAIMLGFNSLLSLYDNPEQPVVITETMSLPSYVFYGSEGMDTWQAIAENNGVVGVSSIGGMDQQVGQFLATEAGVDPDDVNWQVAGSPVERARALVGGQLDAVAGSASSRPLLEAEGLPVLAELSDYVDRFPLEVYAVTQSFYDDNPNTVDAIVRADKAAAQWILDNDNEAVLDVYTKYAEISSTERDFILRSLELYRDGLGLEGFSEEGLELVTRYAIEAGNVAGASDPQVVIESFIPALR